MAAQQVQPTTRFDESDDPEQEILSWINATPSPAQHADEGSGEEFCVILLEAMKRQSKRARKRSYR
jgi:hypothetical protein